MNNTTKHLVRTAAIAAVYVAICIILQPFSYGAIQVRISEALCILPIFTPDAILGLTLGCFFSNMLSFSPIDMLFGTLATLASAICTARLAHVRFKGLPFAACLPPVIFNAVIIGAEITFLFMPEAANASVFLLNMLTVGAGQVISCIVLGLPLFKIIEKTKVLNEFFTD